MVMTSGGRIDAAMRLFYRAAPPTGDRVSASTINRRPPGLLVTVFAWLASLVAIAGIAAIWAGASLVTAGNVGWMALVAAADAALLLRLAGYPGGNDRALFAVIVTVSTAAFAGFLIATAKIGLAMGLRPVDAIGRMSLDLAWLFVESNAGWTELGWLAAACVLAWRLGR
jgi:hypothetical protein